MYKVKETFEYTVTDDGDFLSVNDVLEMVTDMPCPLWEDCKIPVSEHSNPYEKSYIEICKI